MTLTVSVYLDLFRLLAGLVVFFSHTIGTRLTGFLLPEARSFGSEAVAAFFVLSGFVIGYVADTRENSPRVYAISRLARIYSVALPAIMLTLACDVVGQASQPNLYAGATGFGQFATSHAVLSCLLFVNELWGTHAQLGTDGPYWSLGFEVWYYILFGLVAFLPRALRIPAAVMWLALTGPRIALALPIWLFGYAAYAFSKRRFGTPWAGCILFVVPIVAYLPYHVLCGLPFVLQQQIAPNLGVARGYLYFWGLGALIGLHFIGLCMMSQLAAGAAARVAKPVRWVAGASFTLYLMHLPIAVMLGAIAPWPADSFAGRFTVIGGTLLGVLLLAECGERRKAWWRKQFVRLLATRGNVAT